MIIRFFVPGIPASAGSKRAFPIKKGGIFTGRMAVVDDNPRSREWKNAVASCAAEAYQSHAQLLDGPIRLSVEFRLPRPQGHFGSGKNAGKLRAGCPNYPTTRPDATKLLRGVEDACTQVIWRDDAQIVDQIVAKRYSEKPGAWIEVELLYD
jgi:Holliday junction resolvase RusA-like endonuclease